ncbi:MAG: flagellar basal body L-ring protein FlgH [Synergistales bacterium]
MSGRMFSRGVLLALALFLSAGSAEAESLWVDGPSLFEDHRPSKVGDLVTVVISEKTDLKDEAKTGLSKQNSSSAQDGIGLLDFLRKLGFSTHSTTKGNGSLQRTSNLSGTLSCLVTEVLSGGNLRIEGSKEILNQKEKVSLRVKAVMRPEDVEPDNTIPSERLAEVTVTARGVGTLSDTQNPGLLSRLFNVIF